MPPCRLTDANLQLIYQFISKEEGRPVTDMDYAYMGDYSSTAITALANTYQQYDTELFIVYMNPTDSLITLLSYIGTKHNSWLDNWAVDKVFVAEGTLSMRDKVDILQRAFVEKYLEYIHCFYCTFADDC